MDSSKVILENALYNKVFKLKLIHKVSNSFEKTLSRNKFADKVMQNLWDSVSPYNYLELFDPYTCFYEAVECYRAGLFLGCIVLCRASIESSLYTLVQNRAWLRISRDTSKQNPPKFFTYRFEDPQVVRAINGGADLKKTGNLSRHELYKAGKKLKVLDEKIEKKMETVMEKGDIIMHYDESSHKMLLAGEEEYRQNGAASQESVRKFAEHMKPLLDNKRAQYFLSETADVLKHFAEMASPIHMYND